MKPSGGYPAGWVKFRIYGGYQRDGFMNFGNLIKKKLSMSSLELEMQNDIYGQYRLHPDPKNNPIKVNNIL